ncbi:MAG TPA: hypothetical protein VNX88_23435 [Terriglobales bacterium]|jgi:hypothetical protein|nr:hypothetical protein [Terriglobales bacterium]
MPQKNKMLTCTCGNTDLERVRLRLTSEDGRSLAMVALLCRGDGCGRVTFRPQETPKTEGDHQLSKPANGNFTESAKVIEGAKFVEDAKFVEGAKLVEGARLIESAKVVESAKFVEGAHVTEGARLIEAPKKTEVAKNDVARSEGPKGVAALFERVYTERLVYKAIAERDPNCPTLFDALKRNEQICSGINAAFGQVYQRIEENEDLLAALQSLPSLAGRG